MSAHRFEASASSSFKASRCTCGKPARSVARREQSPVTMQRFAVEYDHRTVGIAVRISGGFIFYASDDEFDAIDGRIFPRVRALERHLKKIGKAQPRGARAAQIRRSLA